MGFFSKPKPTGDAHSKDAKKPNNALHQVVAAGQPRNERKPQPLAKDSKQTAAKNPAELKSLMQKYKKKKDSLNRHLEQVRELNSELADMHKELREAQGMGSPLGLPNIRKQHGRMPIIQERRAPPKTQPQLARAHAPSHSFPPHRQPGDPYEPYPDPPQRHNPARRAAKKAHHRAEEMHRQEAPKGRMFNPSDPSATQKVFLMQMRMEAMQRR